MSKKMLIDARHQEEIRVAVLSNGKVEDFDFESAARMPLRGNIYLARITRVEPSLQAAFVEYGGNRHGFLAFGEIHPDYYQIPIADREILREADALEAELAAKLAELDSESLVYGGDEDLDDDGIVSAEQIDVAEDAGDETSARSTRSDGDDARKGRGRDRRRGGRRRRRGRGDKDNAQGDNEAAGSNTVEVATDAAIPETTGENTHAPAESSVQANDNTLLADTSETPSPTDDVAEKTPPPPEATTSAGPEISADADDIIDLETTEDVVDDGPKSIALEDQPEPQLTQDLPPDDLNPTLPTSDNSSALIEPTTDSSIAAFDDVAEDHSDSSDAPISSDEANAPVAAATDGPIEDVAAPPKSEEEIEANRVDAERAREIADLRKKYDTARKEREKLLRNYRIQEVIKRRQILLIQVVKEERGNKGAALTTYMSLAGRYGVLMPNNARGGGVSRKITNASDRKRLRSAIADLNVPNGQGLIIRTAGAKRTKTEIKRDYDYLSRLWDTIREHTLKSIAPCLIYEEASLIKRAIRDLYDKDTSEIIVEGENGYREAKDFMKMLMPSHAKNVQPYRQPMPLFLKQNVEQQLDEMYQPVVTLKSGGYLVIQQTEALISIDVNSGRATKERSVEATAVKTNSEAAVEVARQCRLRDLAGLVVIDFIDMEENRNNRIVEKKLKEAMKMDRARIQIGNISGFGLMEMSRQRRRSGIVDGTTRACPTCDGAGAVRSVEMAALRILRSIEETAARDRPAEITVKTSLDVALYILNFKRGWLNTIESAHNVLVEITSDHDKNGDQFEITKHGRSTDQPGTPEHSAVEPTSVNPDDVTATDLPTESDEDGGHHNDVEAEEKANTTGDNEGTDRPRKRRRRRKKSGESDANTDEGESASTTPNQTSQPDTEADAQSETPIDALSDEVEAEDEQPKKRRRRGRRGGRKTRSEDGIVAPDTSSGDSPDNDDESPVAAINTDDQAPVDAVAQISIEKPDIIADDAPTLPEISIPIEPTPAPLPKPSAVEPPSPKTPRRGGWWQRALGRE